MSRNLLRNIKDLIDTIKFNFHYLPFKYAIKLPIYVHNIRFVDMKGTITIESENITRGMIVLGVYGVKVFANTGFSWENHGGKVIFKGKCTIGTGGGLSIGKNATLIFGNDFLNSYGLTLIASRKIQFGRCVRIGWNVMILDSNMHPLKNKLTEKKSSGGYPISIGDYNWFSTNCVILPGVNTPERVICGLGTIVTRNVEWKSWSLYGGTPIKKLKDNIYRDYNDDKDEFIYDL